MRRARRTSTLVAAALAVAAVSPASAFGAFAARFPGSSDLFYIAGSNEQNDLSVSLDGGNYTITDRGPGVTLGTQAPCSQGPDQQTVICPAAGITRLTIDTGDRDDRATILADTPVTMRGGDGADSLTGGSGPDEVIGELGGDTLAGAGGADQLFGESADPSTTGANSLDGGPGADIIWGGAGPDAVSGGEGADSLSGFGGDDSEDGGEGPDLVTGGDGNDSMAGGAGDDQLGSPLELTMGAPPERGDDTLEGGPGDDVIRPGAGPTLTTSDSDTLLGGEGRDVVTYDQRAVELAVFLDGSPNDGAAGEGDNVGAGVERLVGGASDDRLTGSAAADEIDGGSGADVVEGGAGDDTLDGGVEDAESDTLAGGDGSDLLRGNAGDDAVGGDAGSDTLQGGEGDDNMRGGGDVDVMTGEAGADELSGGTGNDRMDGAGPAVGEDASDVLRGDDGNDDMRGGAANDTLVGGNGADSMRGEAGTDAADYGLASRPVTVELDGEGNDGAPGERDNVGTDVEDVVGGGVEDTFTGSSEANRLDGGAGEDYVDGASDTDDLRGGAASDVVRARDGERDLVQCGRGPDFAIADPADEVSRNCELADRGTRNVPELGREFVIQGVSGGNQFGLPQMDRTVPLKDLINLPVGSKVDARRGRVSITAAARTRRRRASGVFSDGLFAVLQRRSGASVTELRLRGGNFRRCTRGGGAQATAAQRRRLTIRRLTGRARGRFRTRGNHSAATVRGTAWEMVDRCDGTLTRVRSGVVRVTDFRRGRTVTVRAGQSYLAKAPRAGG